MNSFREDEPEIPTVAPDDAYRRPDGIDDTFAPHERSVPAYTPPPPTVPPEEQASYGRPPGVGAYAPQPGDRVPPRPTQRPVVPAVAAAAFGRTPAGNDGFDAAPGTRLRPNAGEPESPWWKEGADRDPWRNPSSTYWLGRGAVFTRGAPAQLDPASDEERDDDVPVEPDDDDADDRPAKVVGLRRRFGLGATLGALLIAVLAGAIGGGAGYYLADRADNILHRSDVHLSQVGTPANRPPGSVADIAKRVGPAVVSIAVTTSTEYAVGSGVVIDKNGYILTNNHVIAGAANGGSIVVTFSNEDSAKARIVGRDEVSDLAVLLVPDASLTVASLGDSAKLAVGDPVIAIGSPLGLEGTVTTGIVSALDRAVHVFNDAGDSDAYLDAIQTDAAINPGNSGGALVDAAGAVIGINSAAATNAGSGGQAQLAPGIGYAIPIDYARDIAEQLIHDGSASHGALDAHGRTATAGLQQGAYLEQVVPDGAAYQAGLRNGDVIVSADNRVVVSYDQLVVIVQEHKPGDKLPVSYFHRADKKTATVTLGSA